MTKKDKKPKIRRRKTKTTWALEGKKTQEELRPVQSTKNCEQNENMQKEETAQKPKWKQKT